jgi:aminoglycoside phosphotransferase (APT) family kinase protein
MSPKQHRKFMRKMKRMRRSIAKAQKKAAQATKRRMRKFRRQARKNKKLAGFITKMRSLQKQIKQENKMRGALEKRRAKRERKRVGRVKQKHKIRQIKLLKRLRKSLRRKIKNTLASLIDSTPKQAKASVKAKIAKLVKKSGAFRTQANVMFKKFKQDLRKLRPRINKLRRERVLRDIHRVDTPVGRKFVKKVSKRVLRQYAKSYFDLDKTRRVMETTCMLDNRNCRTKQSKRNRAKAKANKK